MRPVEVEAGIVGDFRVRVSGMDAREPEAPARAVEGEEAAIGDERNRTARTIDVLRARSRRTDKIDLLDQRAAGVLEAKQDDLGHDVIQVGGAERAGESDRGPRVIAGAHEIDVGLPVDLPTREEEHVDATLAGAIEQLAPAITEECLPPAAQQRDVGSSVAALVGEQCGCGRNRRGGADRGVAGVADEPGDRIDQQLFNAEVT